VLARSLDGIAYFDCELPRVRQRLSDVEGFLDRHRGVPLRPVDQNAPHRNP
jgi:hypothetical protein